MHRENLFDVKEVNFSYIPLCANGKDLVSCFLGVGHGGVPSSKTTV